MEKKIVEFATVNGEKSVQEIAKKFKIPEDKISTFRKRLKEAGIKTVDGRGRKKIDF